MKKCLLLLIMLSVLSSFSFAYNSEASAESSNSVDSVRPSAIATAPLIAVPVTVDSPVLVAASVTSTSVATQESCIDEELNSEIRHLYELLKEAEVSGDYEQKANLKSRIENLSIEVRERKLNCMNSIAPAATVEPCIDYGLNAELTRLTLELGEAEAIGDREMASAIMAKKEEVIRLMKENREQCIAAKPVSAVSSASSGGAMKAIAACSNLDNYRSKIEYLEKIISNPETYGASQEKIEAAKTELNVLREKISNYRTECNDVVKTNLGTIVSEAVKENEGGAKDIVAYYKARLSQLISSGSDSQTLIGQLRQLRDEIDSLIRELLERQERINAQDISEVVSEIKVTPGKIEADNVEVSTDSKKLVVKVNNELAEIVSNSTSVSLDSDGVSAGATELKVENSTLKVGESEISILPNQIIGIINSVPKKIEIIEENYRAVYRIKADEDRRLLGIFVVNVEKQVKVDGSNGNIISQEMPWWAFLTTAES